ncbi:MAG: PEP-CTERM sorting domain-containing protein [Phycisphaerales bacterium]|nr:PEP-CTERM sorting domain-containing protein [Phycisphaerales bacterium]
MTRINKSAYVGAWMVMLCGAVHATAAVTTFENGPEGWQGPQGSGGITVIDPTGGNPDANFHTTFNNFGITFFNNTNTDFVMDYTQFTEVSLAVDVKVNQIGTFFPVSRPWLVELRDYDNVSTTAPWVSVWYKFTDISAAAHPDWTTFSVTIDDPLSTSLPAGWGGFGDEDPNTFEPILPADRTFTDVLAGIDEIAFTTLEPGFFFSFDDYDVQLDNISIQAVPEPASIGLFGFCAMLCLKRKKRS